MLLLVIVYLANTFLSLSLSLSVKMIHSAKTLTLYSLLIESNVEGVWVTT